jgi:hypothetical protein
MFPSLLLFAILLVPLRRQLTAFFNALPAQRIAVVPFSVGDNGSSVIGTGDLITLAHPLERHTIRALDRYNSDGIVFPLFAFPAKALAIYSDVTLRPIGPKVIPPSSS